MKTYCKPADTDIESADQNLPAVKKCFDGKLKRKDFQRVLIRTYVPQRTWKNWDIYPGGEPASCQHTKAGLSTATVRNFQRNTM